MTYPGTPTFAFDLGTSMYLARSYPGTRTLERKLAKKGPKIGAWDRVDGEVRIRRLGRYS